MSLNIASQERGYRIVVADSRPTQDFPHDKCEGIDVDSTIGFNVLLPAKLL